ncbi:MAG: M1 family metallopeptidase [Calditrichaeota bacterium]|nr:M1 family metallopeptidase [Calditrichota bacterium]
MRVNFDPDNHCLNSVAHISYENNSPDTLRQICFHLFPNSFRHGSVMEREAKDASMTLIHSPKEIGWLRLKAISAKKQGSPLQENLKKISYNEDSTIVCLHLKEPLLPGERLSVSFRFNMKIRKFNMQYDKGGYSGDLFEISQWYPKVCVYDRHGWDADANHFLGEFYGEFGSYKVTISAPENFIIAATGEVVAGDPGWLSVAVDSSQKQGAEKQADPKDDANRREVTFFADQVHDFVWTASPNYVYETDTIQSIPVHVLYNKSERKTWHKNALLAANHTLEWLNRNIGEFPYPTLTLAQGLTDGGMEYPMVTVLGYYDFFIVFHEICHMYFYAAVANNEQTNAWMDEGLATYLAYLFQKEKYAGDYAVVPRLPYPFSKKKFAKFSTYNKVRLNSLYYYLYSGFDRPLNSPSYLTGDYYIYNYHAYMKSSQFFAILDFALGRENFFRMLQYYYQHYKFKHVGMEALKQSCEAVSPGDWDEFFQKWVHDVPKVDFALRSFRSQKTGNGRWQTKLDIRNLGNTILPTEVELITAGRDTIVRRIFDGSKNDPLLFTTKNRVKEVRLDPRDIILDQNRLNNGNVKCEWFFYPEFPSMYYMPRDAYAIFYFPQAWYNDIDGFKPGVQFLGSYLNRYYITRSRIWYNTKKQNFDYQFSYSMPWERFGRNVWRHVQWQQIDGKRAVSANIQFNRYHFMAGRPIFTCRVGFQHYKLTNSAYNYDKVRIGGKNISALSWEPGNLNQIFLQAKYSHWKKIPYFSAEIKASFSDRAFDSDFDYLKSSLNLQVTNIRLPGKSSIDLGSFLGISSSESMPLQDRFGVAGASPIQKLNYFYLRAPNFLSTYFHYYLPGGANLRGYNLLLDENNRVLSGDKILSASIRINREFCCRQLPAKWRSFAPKVDGYIFLGGGKVWDKGLIRKLFDAGIGVVFSKQILGKERHLRVEFPLWLSQPNLGNGDSREKNWQFRWLISFQ